jgi:hypothetical protein
MARQSTSSLQLTHPVALIATGVVVLLLAGTTALWAHYGTVVFFEMVASGIATCF